MDIYQIIRDYNAMWSTREVICFSLIMIVVTWVVIAKIQEKKWSYIQGGSIICLFLFLGIVFASTIFTRTTTYRRYELIPLWSYRQILLYHNWELVKENLLNCILLAPVGFLLPLIVGHKVKPSKAFLVGFSISFVIEISQLIFKRGFFEWDDMLHNALGCMLACMIMNIFIKSKRRPINPDKMD